MSGSGSAITIYSIRIPALVVGLSVSITAHAGLMAMLAVIPSGRDQLPAKPPVLNFALGEPIQVRIVSSHALELIPQDETDDQSVSIPESLEPTLQIAPTAVVEAEAPSKLEKQTSADELDQDMESPASVRVSVIDWMAFVESFQPDMWSSLIASSPNTSTTGSSVVESVEKLVIESEKENFHTSLTTTGVVTSSPKNQPASNNNNTPRGIDRGVTIIDLPQPVYPRRSIRLEQEGTALVEIIVRADGTVGYVKLRTSSGHKLLDEAAIKSARIGQFSPALQNGRPIEAIVVVPFQFKLTTEKR